MGNKWTDLDAEVFDFVIALKTLKEEADKKHILQQLKLRNIYKVKHFKEYLSVEPVDYMKTFSIQTRFEIKDLLQPQPVMVPPEYGKSYALTTKFDPEIKNMSCKVKVGKLFYSGSYKLHEGMLKVKSNMKRLVFPVLVKVLNKSDPEVSKLTSLFETINKTNPNQYPEGIVKIYGAAKLPEGDVLVEEPMAGSLYEVLYSPLAKYANMRARLSLQKRFTFMVECAQIVEFLHKLHKSYRNLKSGHFLVDPDLLNVYGADVAPIREDWQAYVKGELERKDKSILPWLAPERLHQTSDVQSEEEAFASDVYSLGIVLAELYWNKKPFRNITTQQLPSGEVSPSVNKDEVPYKKEEMVTQHELLRRLLNECWHSDWKKRPTADDVVHRLKNLQAKMNWQQELDMRIPDALKIEKTLTKQYTDITWDQARAALQFNSIRWKNFLHLLPEHSIDIFEYVLESENLASLYFMGEVFEKSLYGVSQNMQYAFELYDKGASLQYKPCQHKAERMYQKMSKEEWKTHQLKWILIAKAKHEPEAVVRVAYYAEMEGASLEKVMEQLEETAKKGYPPAQYYYGRCLWRKNNIQEARKWFELAASKDYTLGHYGLGVLNDSHGPLQKAIVAHNAEAEQKLGWLYILGKGVTKDAEGAVELLQRATEQELGLIELAECYLDGHGVAQSSEKGLELLERATILGEARAAELLSQIYKDGRAGIEKNPDLSIKYSALVGELKHAHQKKHALGKK